MSDSDNESREHVSDSNNESRAHEVYLGEPSPDEVGPDLAPRDVDSVRRRKQFGTRRTIILGSLIAAVVLGFFALKLVGDATLYFRTADEALAQKSDLGSRRFRLEGCVARGSVAEEGNEVHFVVAGTSARVAVVHKGAPPELFREQIPVVLEGRWDGDAFHSDTILVRHSETYVAKNADRIAPDQCSSDGDAARVS